MQTGEGGSHSAGERQLVVFSLAGESYGVSIAVIREIITLRKVTPVPKSPDYMVGIINLRGRVIPVIDLRSRLMLPAAAAGGSSRIMVVELEGLTVGCVVDSVSEVLTVAEEVIDPPSAASLAEADYLEGIAKLPDSLVILVSLEKAIGAGELREVRQLSVS